MSVRIISCFFLCNCQMLMSNISLTRQNSGVACNTVASYVGSASVGVEIRVHFICMYK